MLAGEPAAPPRPVWRARLRALLLNTLPGIAAGTQLTGLLFFLNPRIPFSVGPLVRGVLLLGGLGGLASGTVLSFFTWRRPGTAGRWLAWALTVVLGVAAAGDGLHASLFAFYLPPGINVRLLKVAVWLSLGSLFCFYTALLHTLHHRPYRRRSQVALWLAALLSVFVLIERRDSYVPEARPATQPSTFEREPRPTVFVVGLEGATLDAILPLASQGQVPFLARLIEEGAYARVKTFGPLNDDALWTTIATGKYPYKHGILGPSVYSAALVEDKAVLRLLPFGVDFPNLRRVGWERRPTTARLRDAMAGWQVLARFGEPAGLIGWPATSQADEGLGFAFSDRYFHDDYSLGTARPPELAERGILFRLAVDELDTAVVEPFGQEVPHPILRALAGDLWRESLTTFLLGQERPVRASFVVLPGLGEISRRYFGGFSAVQFDGIRDPRSQASAAWVTAYYRHLDGFLASLWGRVNGPKMMVVASAYGTAAPAGASKLWAQLSRQTLSGTVAGKPDGVLILRGRGFSPGAFIEGATLVDVLPTLLYALGLPIAQDLDGRVLTSAFEPGHLARYPLTFVPSYEGLSPGGELSPSEPASE
jgi:Type I phosphodiesterase / nucleotide pyrophosphatase